MKHILKTYKNIVNHMNNIQNILTNNIVVVLLFHFVGAGFCCVCWICVWYGLPVLGSYLDAVASALMPYFLACAVFLWGGMLCNAPNA